MEGEGKEPEVSEAEYVLRYFVFVAAFFFSFLAGQAQDPGYFSINSDRGLPENKIYRIHRDTAGFIWLGTEAGLFRFNGVGYTPFKSAAQKARAISGVQHTASGKLYCYNFKGQIFRVQGDSLQEIEGFSDIISSMDADEAGNIWVTGNKGLHRYEESTERWTLYDPPTVSGGLHGAMADSQNRVWVMSHIGPAYFRDGKFQFFPGFFGPDFPFRGTGFFVESGNSVWLISHMGGYVYRFLNERLVPYTLGNVSEEIVDKKINYAFSLSPGTLGICTYSGLVLFHTPSGWARTIFESQSVSFAITDSDERLWVSTLNNGLLYVPELDFQVWGPAIGVPGPEKVSKLALSAEKVMYSTENGHLGHVDVRTGQIQEIQIAEQQDIQALFVDPADGKPVFAAGQHIFTVRNAKPHILAFDMHPVKTVASCPAGYVAGTSYGVFLLDKFWKMQDTLATYWTRSISYDSLRRRLWLATNGGLLLFENFPENVQGPDRVFFPDTQIVSLDRNPSDGTVFGAQYNGQLVAVSSDLQVDYPAALPQEFLVKKMHFAAGRLFIATQKGLIVADPRSRRYFLVNQALGLLDDVVEDVVVSHSHIWVATPKGIQSIPLSYRPKRFKSKVFLSGIRVGNAIISQPPTLSLAYREPFYIIPEATAYSSLGDFRFAVRTLPHNPDWQYFPANIGQIPVSLPAGNFTLELKAVDFQGDDSENTLILSGNVKPPFWQTRWFFLVVMLLLAGLAYWFFSLRIRALKKKQERELSRLRLENELNEQRQAALKAQMNPHFIFNVLNSIKSFIYENDKRRAALYLSRFSDLIRKVLTQSTESRISLKEELEVLDLYIQLEAMLLGDDFTYSVTCFADSDPEAVHIPSLFIQPVVENAFKHGLRHKNGHKRLTINITAEADNFLGVEITDNGVGRAAAAKINEQNRTETHVSFAGEAVKKRIELLNSDLSQEVSLRWEDLYDEQGIPSGTSVFLKIKWE